MRPSRIRDFIMKKTIFTLIVCLACGLAYAEELKSAFTHSYFVAPISAEYPKIQNIWIDKSKNQQVLIDIYNIENFGIDKQIKFSIPETNSDIECRLIFDKYVFVMCDDTTLTWEDSNRSTLKLYTSTGTLIYDFGKSTNFWVPITDALDGVPGIWEIASNKLLFVISNGVDENVRYEYYTLTFETTESGVQSVQVEKKAAFPCPARGEVNIPTRGQQGDLRVLNLNGQVLDAQRIQEGDYQRVNTESYPAGTYIYQVGNETGKFMVE